MFVEKTSVEFNDSSHFLDIVADDERSFFMSVAGSVGKVHQIFVAGSTH